jgi:toxin CcdB
MPRHDVYASGDGSYWLDCQSDLLSGLNSRFVAPLQPRGEVQSIDQRLNPIFVIDGREHVMQTHLAAAVPARLLRDPITSFAEHEYRIGAALDMLIGTF